MTDGITLADLDAAFRAMLVRPKCQRPKYIVHPDEAAWIRHPVGDPPSALAVAIALELGAITLDHPAVQARDGAE